MRYLINMTYDGKDFYGYQKQNNNITVQGTLEEILSKIFNEKIKTITSSRTDRFVHALDQYCHFDSDKKINTKKLKNSLNKLSYPSLYIKNVKIVSNDFHARYNVIQKTYIYKINMKEYNPVERDYILQYNKKINKEILNNFITKLNGTHNFKSFTSDKHNNNYERNLQITYKISKNILTLTFVSTGFLRYMIRNIVGLLLDINDNKKNINDIDKIFSSLDRKSLGTCAKGNGLYLLEVKYDKR